MNTVVHPLPVLLNAGRIESGEQYRHYMDGITPAIGDLIEQMDQERLAVGRAYGLDILSLRDAYVHYYHVQAEKMSDLCHLSTAHAGIMAPTKSVTAVIGIDRSGKEPRETEMGRCGKKNKCAACGNVDCPFRQEES